MSARKELTFCYSSCCCDRERYGRQNYQKVTGDGVAGGASDLEANSQEHEIELPSKSKNAFVILPEEEEEDDDTVTVDFSSSSVDSLDKPSDATKSTFTAAVWDQGFLNSCWKFLALGIPGMIMTSCESWSFEVATIFAAQLGTVPLDAHAIMYAISRAVRLGVDRQCSDTFDASCVAVCRSG